MESLSFPLEVDLMSQRLSRRRLLASAAAGLVLAFVRPAMAASASSLPPLSDVLAGDPGSMNVVNYALYVHDRDKVNASRAAHQAYADALREHDRLVMGGPLVDDEGRPRGVLLVYDVASKRQAETLAQGDPFALNGAIADYRLDEWRVVDSNADLLAAALVPEEGRAAPPARPVSGPKPADRDAPPARTYVDYVTFVSDRAHVERVQPAHQAYSRTLEAKGKLIVAGPFAGGTGALVVYRAQSKDEATALALGDPYHAEGVVETHELSQWRLFGLNARLIRRR